MDGCPVHVLCFKCLVDLMTVFVKFFASLFIVTGNVFSHCQDQKGFVGITRYSFDDNHERRNEQCTNSVRNDGLEKCSWTKAATFILFVLSLVGGGHTSNSTETNSIEVKLAQSPVTFGGTVYLECIIPSTTTLMTWSKIPNGDIITWNNISLQASKYDVYTNSDPVLTTYYLIIKDLDLSDINCQYKCDADFQWNITTLQLNPQDYVYPPKEITVKHDFEISEGKLTKDFLIDPVYPRPICIAFFERENITEDIFIKNEKHLGFFTTHIKLQMSTENCDGQITLNCTVGNVGHYVDHLEHVHKCAAKEVAFDVYSALIIAGSVLVIVIVMIAIVIFFVLRSKSVLCRRSTYSTTPTTDMS